MPRSINTVLLRCSRKQVTFDQTGSTLKKQPDFLAMIAPLQLNISLSVKSAMDVNIQVCRLSLGYHMGAVFPSYPWELNLVHAEQAVKALAHLRQLPFQ